MRIDQGRVADVVVLSLSGGLTGESQRALPITIVDLLNRDDKKIAVNMASVSAIDSSGLADIAKAALMVSGQGGRLVFCNAPQKIVNIWSITRLESVFEMYESIDEAVESFGTTRFEVSCPVCKPTMWTGYVSKRFLHSCTACDSRFSPNVQPGVLALLEETSSLAAARVVTAPVSDLWWFTYYENGYGQEGVHLTVGRPTTVAVTGRLDLFAFDIVQLAWDALPRPRRVLFDTTHVRVASRVGRARLDELCAAGDGDSRSIAVTTAGDRDRAVAALGSLENAPQSIEVSIRRRA